MAQRRMFSKEITTSDTFVDMPMSSQLLYFHLGMEADDEGFIGNAKMLSRAYGANNDDLTLLRAKGFIIMFENGVTVVKDWNVNNKIRKDRVKSTIYRAEKSLLNVDVDGSYYMDNQMTTIGQPNDNQMSAQDRLGKDRLGKDSIMSSSDEHDPSLAFVTKQLIEKINQLSGSKYRVTDKAKSLVKARLKDYTSDELMQMLDYVWNDWSNWNERSKYFRPQTLFAPSKTDEYVAKMQAKPIKQETDPDDWLAQITEAADNA